MTRARLRREARREDGDRLHRLRRSGSTSRCSRPPPRRWSTPATRTSPTGGTRSSTSSTKCGVRFAHEVHPSEIAYDYWTTRRDARGHRAPRGVRPQLGPVSHMVWQDIDPVGFLWDFKDRIYHVRLQGHEEAGWATAATAGSAPTCRGPTRAAAGTSSPPGHGDVPVGGRPSGCSTPSATTARSRSSGRTPAWTAWSALPRRSSSSAAWPSTRRAPHSTRRSPRRSLTAGPMAPLDLRARRGHLGLSAHRTWRTPSGCTWPPCCGGSAGRGCPGRASLDALAHALTTDRAAVVGFFDAHRRPAPPRTRVRATGLRTLRHRAAAGRRPTSPRWWASPSRPSSTGSRAGQGMPVELVPRVVSLLREPDDRLSPQEVRALLTRHRPLRPPRHGPLRRARGRSGLSQQRLAEQLGVSRQLVGCWERGLAPRIVHQRGIARILGTDVATVSGWFGTPPPLGLRPARWRPGDLGQVLRDLRAWSGLSQGDVARPLRLLDGCRPGVGVRPDRAAGAAAGAARRSPPGARDRVRRGPAAGADGSRPMTLVLGVDSSTQSTKAVLVDVDDGMVVETRTAPHPPGTRGRSPCVAGGVRRRSGAPARPRLRGVRGRSAARHGRPSTQTGTPVRPGPAVERRPFRSVGACAGRGDGRGPGVRRRRRQRARRLLHLDQAQVAPRPRARRGRPRRRGPAAARLRRPARCRARHAILHRPGRRLGHRLLRHGRRRLAAPTCWLLPSAARRPCPRSSRRARSRPRRRRARSSPRAPATTWAVRWAWRSSPATSWSPWARAAWCRPSVRDRSPTGPVWSRASPTPRRASCRWSRR